MKLIFNEKKTSQSIKLFKDFQKKFEQEISERGINGLIENSLCEEYFFCKNTKNEQISNN